ncbi:hypothetical protein B0H10DRAFT_1968605 [Mycena sp. CBHHK59/15]|nr:hypothetical protein B0H10DRAFT_1968605 [Mycena sp. CBHHK59/15]
MERQHTKLRRNQGNKSFLTWKEDQLKPVQAKDGDTSSSAFIRLERKAAYRVRRRGVVPGKLVLKFGPNEGSLAEPGELDDEGNKRGDRPSAITVSEHNIALTTRPPPSCYRRVRGVRQARADDGGGGARPRRTWAGVESCTRQRQSRPLPLAPALRSTTETHGQEAAWELRWYWARRRRGCEHGRPSGAALEPAPTQLKDVSAADVDRRARSGSTTSQLEGEETEQGRHACRKARKEMLRLAAAFAESGEPNSPEFEGFPGSWSGELPPQLTFRALRRRPAQEADALAHLAAQDDEDSADLDGLAYARSALRGMGGSQSQPRSSGRSSNSETVYRHLDLLPHGFLMGFDL